MTELLIAFQLGLLNMTNACVLPLYPGFLAYLAVNRQAFESRDVIRWLGLVTMAGLLTSMLLIGLVLWLLRVAVESLVPVLLPVVYLLVIGMGILLVLGKNPFERLPMLTAPRFRNPLFTSFVYGMLYAPMTLPCSGAFLVNTFVLSVDATSLIEGIAYVIMFGFGFGLPLLVLPLVAEPAQKVLLRLMTRHHVLLMRISGILLIVIGVAGFIQEWALRNGT